MKQHFYTLFILFFIAACAATDNTPNQSYSFYVRYLAQEQNYRAEASMSTIGKDGKKQEIEIPGGIYFRKQEMQPMPYQGMRYRADHSGPFSESNTFSWRNPESDESYSFDLSISPIRKYGFQSDTLQRNQVNNFGWEGQALQPGETLVFLWQSLKGDQTKNMELRSTNPIPIIEFPAAKISELEPGIWTLYLVRKKLIKGQAAGAPAEGIIEFYTHTDTLVVQ
jgi:hypothetical protein